MKETGKDKRTTRRDSSRRPAENGKNSKKTTNRNGTEREDDGNQLQKEDERENDPTKEDSQSSHDKLVEREKLQEQVIIEVTERVMADAAKKWGDMRWQKEKMAEEIMKERETRGGYDDYEVLVAEKTSLTRRMER
jgi:hypothetical protein